MPPKKGDKGGKKGATDANEQTKQDKSDVEKKKRDEEAALLATNRHALEEEYKRQLQVQRVHNLQFEETNQIWKQLEERVDSFKKDYRDAVWLKKSSKSHTLFPNPLNLKDVNDYIGDLHSNIQPLKEAVRQNNEALQVIYNIKYTESLHPDINVGVKKSWKEHISSLEASIEQNLKMAVLHTLLEHPRHINSQTSNFQFHAHAEHTTICLWANTSKNPKINSFEFCEAGIKFDVPRSLAVAENVIQLYHTDYDNFTHYCSTYINKSKPKLEEPEVFVKKPPPVTETELGSGIATAPIAQTAPLLSSIGSPANFADGDTMSETAASRTLDDSLYSNLDASEYNLNEFVPVDGVWQISVLVLPHVPLLGNLANAPKSLEEVSYEFPHASGSGTSRIEESEKFLGIHIQWPEHILWCDPSKLPAVARWDAKKQCWTSKNVRDIKYDEDKKVVSCRLTLFGPIALMQFKHSTLPYQSWSMCPIDKETVNITIQTMTVTATFQIIKHECALVHVSSNGQDYMQNFYGKAMSPKILLKEMQHYGANFYPDHDSFRYLRPELIMKDWNMESKFYQNVGIICGAYEVGSTVWSRNSTSRTGIIKMREYVSSSMKGRPCIVKASLRKTAILRLSESCPEFCDDELPDQEHTADLYHLVLSMGSDEAKQAVNSANKALRIGVCDFLTCAKPLSYCQPTKS